MNENFGTLLETMKKNNFSFEDDNIVTEKCLEHFVSWFGVYFFLLSLWSREGSKCFVLNGNILKNSQI